MNGQIGGSAETDAVDPSSEYTVSYRTDRIRRTMIWGVAFSLVVVAILKTPGWTPDSQGYVQGAIVRPPVIPIVFRVLHTVLSHDASLRVFNALQAAMAIISCRLLALELGKRLSLTQSTAFLVGLVLSIPQWRAATLIMSESLSYSMLCISFYFGCRLLAGDRTTKAFVGLCVSTVTLVLTRAQFIFLAPFVGLTFIFLIASERRWIDKLKIFACGLAVAATALSFQAGYSYSKSGRITGVPMTGIQALTVAAFLATESDIAAIPDEEARSFTQGFYAQLREHRLHISDRGELGASQFLDGIYNKILADLYRQYSATHVKLGENVSSVLLAEHYDNWIDLDRLTLKATRGIVANAGKRIAVFAASSILASERSMIFLAFGIVALGLAMSARGQIWPRFVVLASVLWGANVLLIVALEPLLMRYTFYLDTILVAVVLATMFRGPDRMGYGAS